MTRRSKRHISTVSAIAAGLTSWLAAGYWFVKHTEQTIAAYEQKNHMLGHRDLEGLYLDLDLAPFLIGGVALILGLVLLIAWLWPPDGPFSEDTPRLHKL